MLSEREQSEVINFVLEKFPNADSSRIEFNEYRKLSNSNIVNLDIGTANGNVNLIVKIRKDRCGIPDTIEEYNKYNELEKITEGAPFTTVKTVGYIESLPALVSYRLEGNKLSDRFASANEDLLYQWVSQCGEYLGLYHINYPLKDISSYEPEDKLYKYFSGKAHFDKMIAGLDKNRFCYRYIDFALANTLVLDGNRLCFIDPPEWEYPGLIYNDIAKFWNSTYRAVLRRSLKTLNFNLSLCNELYGAFLESYEAKRGIKLTQLDHYMIDITKILMIEQYFSISRFLTGIKNGKSLIERYKTIPADIPLLIKKKIKVSKMHIQN